MRTLNYVFSFSSKKSSFSKKALGPAVKEFSRENFVMQPEWAKVSCG